MTIVFVADLIQQERRLSQNTPSIRLWHQITTVRSFLTQNLKKNAHIRRTVSHIPKYVKYYKGNTSKYDTLHFRKLKCHNSRVPGVILFLIELD